MSAPTARGGLRKVRRATFVQVPSETIRDKGLSYRARGVLSFLLDHPDGFDVRATYIAGQGTEGRDAIESALGELRARGYYRLERRRLSDGTFAMGTAIAEAPVEAWIASHRRHGGRAVPCRLLEDGRVVELDPAPETDSQGPEDRRPEDRQPVDRSPTQTETTDGKGEELVDELPSAPAVPLSPPARTCRVWPAPHGACGACADDRRALDAHEAAAITAAKTEAAAAHTLARIVRAERRALADAEVGACRLCDDTGTAHVGDTSVVCLHDADRNRRALEARRAARSAITRNRTPEA